MPISMPVGLPIQSVHFGLQHNTQLHTSPLSNTTQRVELPSPKWIATYTLTPEKREEVDLVKAFLLQLRGAAKTFYGYDPSGATPKGLATGSPLVKGGGQTGTSLITDGWTPDVTGILKTGDYFSVNDELKMLVADANSDGSGEATLLFEPPLRGAPADNAVITVNKATCVMRLIDDNQSTWDVDVAQFHSIAFSAIESIF